MKSTILLISTNTFIYNMYLKILAVVSVILSMYFGLEASLKVLGILLVLDSLTRIHATGMKSKTAFNPFKLEFWLVIKSKGLKLALNKAFLQYGIYFTIAFVIDKFILNQLVVVNFNDNGYTLPVVTLWICSGIEVWSIGENIEDAGGINIPKRVIHFFDEKYQKIFKKENNV